MGKIRDRQIPLIFFLVFYSLAARLTLKHKNRRIRLLWSRAVQFKCTIIPHMLLFGLLYYSVCFFHCASVLFVRFEDLLLLQSMLHFKCKACR